MKIEVIKAKPKAKKAPEQKPDLPDTEGFIEINNRIRRHLDLPPCRKNKECSNSNGNKFNCFFYKRCGEVEDLLLF